MENPNSFEPTARALIDADLFGSFSISKGGLTCITRLYKSSQRSVRRVARALRRCIRDLGDNSNVDIEGGDRIGGWQVWFG